ncbi:MAG: hypothetical protein ACYCUZ_07610 [Cuniculiplasma sp.]
MDRKVKERLEKNIEKIIETLEIYYSNLMSTETSAIEYHKFR